MASKARSVSTSVSFCAQHIFHGYPVSRTWLKNSVIPSDQGLYVLALADSENILTIHVSWVNGGGITYQVDVTSGTLVSHIQRHIGTVLSMTDATTLLAECVFGTHDKLERRLAGRKGGRNTGRSPKLAVWKDPSDRRRTSSGKTLKRLNEAKFSDAFIDACMANYHLGVCCSK